MFKKTFIIAITLLCGVLSGAPLQPAEAAVAFPDVPSNHWAYSTIQWAVDNDVVNGYPDGTFRPGQQVTEAEFLTMFIQAFDKLPTIDKTTHWADPAYQIARIYNWPTMGLDNPELRDKTITRVQVAEIIAGANGLHFVGKDAIQYLLNTNISKGKTDATIEGFKGEDFLTRAEAVQFIKNAKDNGMKVFRERDKFPTPLRVMPQKFADGVFPPIVHEVKVKMEEIVASDFPDYLVTAREEVVNIHKGKTGALNLSVSYSMATMEGGLDSVISFKAMEDDSLRLAVKMLQAAGVPVKDDFFDTLKEAARTGKESEHKVGNRELFVRPHPTNANHITIQIVK